MKESLKGFPFSRPLSLKNSSIILLGNFFLAILGSCLLSSTKKDPLNSSRLTGKKYFDQKSTELNLFITLTFPYDSRSGPKPFSLLDESKKTLVKKAFLLPQIKNKGSAWSLENNQKSYLVAIPTKNLKALIPHLGKTLWGFPYVPIKNGDKKKEVQKDKKESYEISF